MEGLESFFLWVGFSLSRGKWLIGGVVSREAFVGEILRSVRRKGRVWVLW